MSAKPGRSTCSKNPFSSAGMVPSQSGKMMRMGSAHGLGAWEDVPMVPLGAAVHKTERMPSNDFQG